MRLFIAIRPEEPVLRGLTLAVEHLRAGARKGSFTREENLHLTLVFIGETDRLPDVRRAMDRTEGTAFRLVLRGLGRFRRPGGDIIWAGAEESRPLGELYRRLFENLSRAGFALEDRSFRAHLTLGRGVVLGDGFDREAFVRALPPQEMRVSEISLMKSERIGGRLVYTEIGKKALKQG